MVEWRLMPDDWPDWKDAGPIEVRFAGGAVVLCDLTFDVGGDETPISEAAPIGALPAGIPTYDRGDGKRLVSLGDAEAWRVVTKDKLEAQ